MTGTSTLGIVTAVGLTVLLCGCRSGPSRAQLDADNPIRPIAAPPFGMEEFFKEAPQEPTPERARLGRWLFFDKRLSADNTVSCATCHRPEFAFSEPTQVSVGVGGQKGRRKAQSLVNLAARTVLVDTPTHERGPAFFWDGRAPSLEAQVLVPIADLKEMALDHRAMTTKLSSIAGYGPYFREAFGSDEPTLERVAAALADYVRTRKSGNAAYDRWSYTSDARAMSQQAKRGTEIFFFNGRCTVCHAGFNFSDGKFHNLGVGWNAATQSFADEGRALVTGSRADRGRFKTPGLRDVSKHAPYMHDGSLATLREVVEFYNRGGVANPFRSGRITPLGLTPDDVDALVAFLQALDGEGYADRAPSLFPR